MMPPIASTRCSPSTGPSSIRLAAIVALEANEVLASETTEPLRAVWYRQAADRLSAALEDPEATRQRLLSASPALVELSGRARTLLEMIEDDPGDDQTRLRLAKILLRALSWRTEPRPGLRPVLDA